MYKQFVKAIEEFENLKKCMEIEHMPIELYEEKIKEIEKKYGFVIFSINIDHEKINMH